MALLNTTTKFLFPLLEIPKLTFSVVDDTRYINSYLRDSSIDKHATGHLYVAHSNKQDLGFNEFEDKLINHELFVDGYDICNEQVGIKVFRMPDKYLDDYIAFVVGKYSEYSKEAKEKVLSNNFAIKTMAHKKYIEGVFGRSEELRNRLEDIAGQPLPEGAEVHSIFNESKNVLTEELKKTLFTAKKIKHGG